MRLTAILTLLMGTMAAAGPHNPGPGPDQVVAIWTSQALTSTAVQSALSYPVGLDTGITVDVAVSGAESGDTITVTPTWKRPGGSALEDFEAPQAVTWTAGQPTGFLLTFSAPRGAAEMFLSGQTTSSNGATITASAIGSTNGVGPVAAAGTFSGDVATTTNGHLTNLGYNGLLYDKDDTDTGITNPAANALGIQVGGTEYVTMRPNTEDVLSIIAGTLAGDKSALFASGTLSNALVTFTDALVTLVATAGSSGSNPATLHGELHGFSPGAVRTSVLYAINASFGTGTAWYGGGASNYGVYANLGASGAGVKVGTMGVVKDGVSSTLNVGASGQTVESAAGKNVGGAFISLNAGAGTATGLYVGLDDADPVARLVDAAIQVSNDTQAFPIQVWQDDSTTVAKIDDNGVTTIAPGGVTAIYADTDNVTVTAGSIALGKSVTGRIYSVGPRSSTVTGDSTAAEDEFVESITLPANFLRTGRVLRYHFFGSYDAAAVTSATWRMNLGGTDIAVSDAISLLNSTGNSWVAEGTISVELSGAAGTINAVISAGAESTTDTTSIEIKTTTINTTGAHALTPSIQFSGASASNGALIYGGYVEALN